MIFDVLKSRWLRNEQDKIRKENRQRSAVKPSSMIVLYNADTEKSPTFMEDWAQDLGIQDIRLIGFTKNTQAVSNDERVFLNTRSIKRTGGIADPHLANLLDSKFDLQINYFIKSNELQSYVALAIQAGFKVGLPSQRMELYDLAIDVSLDQKELFQTELKKYLNIITQ